MHVTFPAALQTLFFVDYHGLICYIFLPTTYSDFFYTLSNIWLYYYQKIMLKIITSLTIVNRIIPGLEAYKTIEHMHYLCCYPGLCLNFNVRLGCSWHSENNWPN